MVPRHAKSAGFRDGGVAQETRTKSDYHHAARDMGASPIVPLLQLARYNECTGRGKQGERTQLCSIATSGKLPDVALFFMSITKKNGSPNNASFFGRRKLGLASAVLPQHLQADRIVENSNIIAPGGAIRTMSGIESEPAPRLCAWGVVGCCLIRPRQLSRPLAVATAIVPDLLPNPMLARGPCLALLSAGYDFFSGHLDCL